MAIIAKNLAGGKMIEKLIYPTDVTMTPEYIEDTYVYELFYDSPYDRITPEEAAKYISDITTAC